MIPWSGANGSHWRSSIAAGAGAAKKKEINKNYLNGART